MSVIIISQNHLDTCKEIADDVGVQISDITDAENSLTTSRLSQKGYRKIKVEAQSANTLFTFFQRTKEELKRESRIYEI